MSFPHFILYIVSNALPFAPFTKLALECGFTQLQSGELISPHRAEDLSAMLETFYLKAVDVGRGLERECAARAAVAAELDALERALLPSLTGEQAQALTQFKEAWQTRQAGSALEP